MAQNIETALYLMVIGIGVVFIALTLLQAFTNAIGAFDRLLRRFGARPTPEALPSPTATDPEEEEEAVIAAAMATALARRVEIHHIRMLHDETMETWSRVGRLDIMRSHDRGSGRP